MFICKKCLGSNCGCFIKSHGPCEICGNIDICVDCHCPAKLSPLQREILLAERIAKEAHKNDRRRNGEPYFNGHVSKVAENVSHKAKPAAYCHDVQEDHPDEYANEVLLKMGLSRETVEVINLLNKQAHGDINYLDYIKLIKINPIAREVKIADIKHNLFDAPSNKQIVKYLEALRILLV